MPVLDIGIKRVGIDPASGMVASREKSAEWGLFGNCDRQYVTLVAGC